MHAVKLREHAPYWSLITVYILRKGYPSHSKILSRAMKLCKEDTGDCIGPDIPELYWEQAINEIIEIEKR